MVLVLLLMMIVDRDGSAESFWCIGEVMKGESVIQILSTWSRGERRKVQGKEKGTRIKEEGRMGYVEKKWRRRRRREGGSREKTGYCDKEIGKMRSVEEILRSWTQGKEREYRRSR